MLELAAVLEAPKPPIKQLGLSRVRGVTVSTIEASRVDKGGRLEWETAVVDGRGCYPVERYPSRELALVGHLVWSGRAGSLVEVESLGYPEFGEPSGKRYLVRWLDN